MQHCKYRKAAIGTGLGQTCLGEFCGSLKMPPSLYHYWSHICMGGPWFSLGTCATGDVPSILAPHSLLPTHLALIWPQGKLDPLIWVQKIPMKTEGEGNNLHPEQQVDPAHQRGAGIGWKHKEGKLPEVGAQREQMELQAQFLLPDPSQLWGLWRTFISLAAPIPAAWGKTGNWNMEGNDEWSFTETFWHDTHFHNPSPSASYQPFSCISPNLCGGSVSEETSTGAGLLLTKTGFPV